MSARAPGRQDRWIQGETWKAKSWGTSKNCWGIWAYQDSGNHGRVSEYSTRAALRLSAIVQQEVVHHPVVEVRRQEQEWTRDWTGLCLFPVCPTLAGLLLLSSVHWRQPHSRHWRLFGLIFRSFCLWSFWDNWGHSREDQGQMEEEEEQQQEGCRPWDEHLMNSLGQPRSASVNKAASVNNQNTILFWNQSLIIIISYEENCDLEVMLKWIKCPGFNSCGIQIHLSLIS